MTILYMLQVLLGFGFVIAIHEAGHFFAAKRVGIKCPAFSIGFPVPIWTPKGWKAYNIFRYKWRGTEYRLGWIPFGGYVQMQGQADNPAALDEASKDDKGDYRNKSYWQKTQVLLGGVTMNAITAVIGFIIAFQVGVTFIEPTVGLVDPRSQTWVDNEIQVGDKILTVNGRDVVDFEDVVYAGIFDGGDTILLEVASPMLDGAGNPVLDGEGEPRYQPSRKVTVKLDEDKVFGLKLPAIKAKHRVILTGEEAERFPESLGDDRPEDGDEIVSVNGRPVRNAEDAQGFIETSNGPVVLGLRRGFDEDARKWTVTYEPRRKFWSANSAYVAGIALAPTPYVDRVRKGGPGEKAGLKPGDKLVAVKGPNGETPVLSVGDLNRLVDAAGSGSMTLVIERAGSRVEIVANPEERESRPGRYQLGLSILPFAPDGLTDAQITEKHAELARSVVAYSVRPGSEAEKKGLRAGDKIVGVKVGGEAKTNPDTGAFDRLAFDLGMKEASDMEGGTGEITLEVQRDSGLETIVLKPDATGPDSGAYLLLATAEQRSKPVTYGLVESVKQGFYHSKKVGYKIIMTLGALFTGRVKIWHLGGPVVIAKRSYSLAQWGAGTLLFFLAFISVNLAIVNLLPIPSLDGGQWLIVSIEAIRGKPIPEKAMRWVSYPSVFFMIGLMLFVLANDLLTVFWRKWV